MQSIKQSDLFKAMMSCGRYENEQDVLDTIEFMREQVEDGENPEELLHEAGFELDYIFDIIN